MTGSDIKLVHEAIGEAVRAFRFEKSGSRWYHDASESVLLIAPQKSQYDAVYFLNLGIYFRELGEEVRPREEICHVRGRIETLIPEVQRDDIRRALDFGGDSLDSAKRANLIAHAVEAHAVPLLLRCCTMEGLRAELRSAESRRLTLTKDLAVRFNALDASGEEKLPNHEPGAT
jgi:hypothetical protein